MCSLWCRFNYLAAINYVYIGTLFLNSIIKDNKAFCLCYVKYKVSNELSKEVHVSPMWTTKLLFISLADTQFKPLRLKQLITEKASS